MITIENHTKFSSKVPAIALPLLSQSTTFYFPKRALTTISSMAVLPWGIFLDESSQKVLTWFFSKFKPKFLQKNQLHFVNECLNGHFSTCKTLLDCQILGLFFGPETWYEEIVNYWLFVRTVLIYRLDSFQKNLDIFYHGRNHEFSMCKTSSNDKGPG